MKIRQVFASSLLALVLCLWATRSPAASAPPSKLAAKLGITVQQLQSLEARFSLSDAQVAGLASYQLQLMLADLDHPGIAKHDGQQNFQMLKLRDEHGQIPPDGLMRALEHRRHAGIDEDLFPGTPDESTATPDFGTPGTRAAGITSGGWTWLGPGNIGGRVRSILVHPTATNILWCGGVDGGVWKSTNSGAAWFPLNDFMANLAIACMVMDPANSNVLYAGTGEATYNLDAIRGAGIFKSTDGGTTWGQLASTANASFQYVARLAVDPNNSQVLLAATRSGIYRSTDGGTNWTARLAVEMLDVQYHPTDSLQAIASTWNAKAYYSTDGGVSWTQATGLPALSGFVVGRTEVTYARSAPLVVYASLDNSSGQIYGSSDGGHTFALRNTGNSFLGGQGWYDNIIWVDPTTTNLLVVGGGPDLWRSTDGGATLTKISQWQSAPSSAHADHHAIVAAANYNGSTVRTVYFGNDGGVYRAADVSTVSLTSGWQSLNNNLGITQFYGGAGNASSGIIVGGTQDNGSLRYSPAGGTGGWTTMFGGDGGFSASDPTDPNYFYGEYVYLEIHRSANAGLSSSYIYSGITEAGSSTANFISPYILDPNNANTMLGGGSQLWRSTNVKAATPSWASIKASISSPISAIAVASGNSDIIWVGHNNGNVYYTLNGTAVTPTWVQADLGTPNLPNRYCGRIAVTPGNANKVYVTFGGYNSGNVWRTLDGGATWTDISGNLPPAPVNCLVLAPGVTNTLYVATEVGIYASTAGGTTWSTGNDGPANVSVNELFWMSNKLVAVTHGRGMWSITPALGGPSLGVVGATIIGGNGNGLVDPNECNQLSLLLQNSGGTAATNVSGVLTSATPGVTITQGSSAFANIAAGGGTATNSTLFRVSTSPAFTCGTAVAVNLLVSYNGSNTVIPLNLASSGTGYSVTTTNGAALVPGSTDIGLHADDATATISLPFTWTFYGQNFITATLSSNGNLQFSSADAAYSNVCLPYSGFSYAIVPLWDDLRTDGGGGGVFTSVTGSAPNRIFNIEWRAAYYASALAANFEIRLYEGQSRFDIIYATVNSSGSFTTGIQSDTGSAYYNQVCNSSGLSDGLQLTFQQTCADGGGACVVGPVASFNASPLSGSVPLIVSFTNQSTGATNYGWAFGDGNTSPATNPANSYVNAGSYTVTLTAIGPGGTNTLTRASYILVTNLPPLADFIAGPTSGLAPLSVSFTNLSAQATNYTWNFGDGNTSTATNPANSYVNAGSYTVTLTAIGPGGTNTLTRASYILATNLPPLADFIAGTTNGPAPLSVSFTNLSAQATNYTWNFGDGNTSTATNPANSYVNAGSYTVTLTAIGPGGTNTLTRASYILVTNLPPLADFIAGPTNGLAPLSVSFTNLSAQATNYTWDFGDGNTSTATNPANSYVNAGSYTVTLTAIGPGGTNTLTRASYILATNLPPVADFTAGPTNGVAPLTVNFTNLSAGATNYFWDFGDGHSSTNDTPANTYTNAGSYAVSLVAVGAGGTNLLARTNYIVVIAPALLVISPAGLDFGLIATDATAQATLVLSNAGGVTLNGTATINPGVFAVISGTPFNLAASDSTNLLISFTPAGEGSFSNVVVFASTGGDSTNALAGRAISSPLISSSMLNGTDFAFSFSTLSGFTYLVQFKDSLTDPVWQSLQTVSGDGTIKTITLPISSAPQRFYRVAAE